MLKSLNPRIRDWQGLRVWLIGASSGIGAALAEALRQRGSRLALSARRAEPLERLAQQSDLVLPLDVRDADALAEAQGQIEAHWGGIDLVIYCAGDYGPMRAWDYDLVQAEKLLDINFRGVLRLLVRLLPLLLRQGQGGLCLVGSVAGYGGLPKALAYGPGKAALNHLAQGLFLDLAPKGIGVYLVSPGFVQTRLTEQNDFRMPALIGPQQAAAEILAGLARGSFEIAFPRRFTTWVRLLALLPHWLRFRLLRGMAKHEA